MLDGVFARIVALRVPILVLFALLAPAAGWRAARIPTESGLGRLIVPDDPDYVATREFQAIFPEGQIVLLLVDFEDPFAAGSLEQFDALEQRLRGLPKIVPFSILDAHRRAHPGIRLDAEAAARLRRFAIGTTFFQKQGLVGDHFLGMVVTLNVRSSPERDAALAAIDEVTDGTVHKVGAPYIEAWIEHASATATARYVPFFGLFIVAIVLFLYRSWRALVAILVALGVAVALGLGAGGLFGYSFTLVSTLVPLTIMATTLASLVYVHSRFVDQPEGVDLRAHHLFALCNKFVPVTASTLAAVLGFAALGVSQIRPVREMGLWTATGLALSWVVVFTLFPALQVVLRAPTGRAVAVRSALYDRLAQQLPDFTRRSRWPLVLSALGLSAAGLVALFGLPGGRIAPMRVGVDALDYIDPSLAIHRDMTFFRTHVSGLNVARVWIRLPKATATDPEVLLGLDRFTSAIERVPDVASVVGPTTFLRLRRYLAGQPEALPPEVESFAAATADIEQLLLTEAELRAFLDVNTLQHAQLTVIFNHGDEAAYRTLTTALRAAWEHTVEQTPALEGAQMAVVGEALLQAKVGGSLVPTVAESFMLTATLIFVVFLFVFRSASARLMAMLPSVFAILGTFLGMRLFGASLNIATILIATMVLGTTENDQIHFFYHLHEADGEGLEAALQHALRVSGRAIVFATLINAAGFLALSMSSFPPLRQLGLITAGAFGLALVADFTALPAALWLWRRG